MSKLKIVEDKRLTVFRRILELGDCSDKIIEEYSETEIQVFVNSLESICDKLKESLDKSTQPIPTIRKTSKLTEQANKVIALVNEVKSYERLYHLDFEFDYSIELLNTDELPNGEFTKTAKIKTENLTIYLDTKFRLLEEVDLYHNNGDYKGKITLKEIYTGEADLEFFKNELIYQLDSVISLVDKSANFETLLSICNTLPYEVEVNGEPLSEYNYESIEYVRIETEHLLLYVECDYKMSNTISVYDYNYKYIGEFTKEEIYNKEITLKDISESL